MTTDTDPEIATALTDRERQSLFARDRELWWLAEANAYAAAGDAVWEARCRNEAAFWAEDAPTLAELIEALS